MSTTKGIPMVNQFRIRVLLVFTVLLMIPVLLLCQHTQNLSTEEDTTTGRDLEVLRERFVEELLEEEIDEAEIADLLESIQEDGTWPNIDYVDTTSTAFEHSQHLNNMVELALAYKQEGSPYYRDAEVKQAVHTALDFWLAHNFICENWWWNQIGTPERIGNVLLIMDEDLTEEQKTRADPVVGRANLGAWGARPGGDLIKIAGIMGKHGLFKRDAGILNEALEAIVGEIGFAVDRGDPSDVRGLQKDYSFHHRHDRVTSTITYGNGYAGAFVDWADRVHGTAFAFPEEAIKLLVDFYLDGINKHYAFGKYPDPGALNRGITRRDALNPRSPEVPEKLLRVTSYRQDELEKLVLIRSGKQKPDLASSQFFWHTEYYSHQRPHFFTSVRMYSTRNHSMEEPYNGEGVQNHHLGDGYNFITRTGAEYIDIFPVWDWQKIPGTTVVQKPSLPVPEEIQQPGLTDFVGGVTDGTYGAAAFDFKSPLDPLSARKCWFFFDDEFVALGTAIRSESPYPVATTLNQSLLQGDVVIMSKGDKSVLDRGEHDLDQVTWIHHDETAYLFPQPAAVRVENDHRTGAWEDITIQSWAIKSEAVQKDVFTLWIDHGITPEQAEYAYIVVPGIEADQVEQYRLNTPIEILANTAALQAVQHRELGLSQIVFYEPGEITIANGITVSAETPGMVMVKNSGPEIKELTVSDPSRQLDTIRLRISARLEGAGARWKTTWNEAEGYTTFQVNLPEGEYAGQSVTVRN